MDGSVAVGFERITDAPDVDAWARAFVERSGHTGFIAFDFIVDDDGRAFAIECNPRATSGIHFIDRNALAAAILGEEATAVSHRPDSRLTESYSCFTRTLGSLFSGQEFLRNLRELRRARDVTWEGDDPWPFLLMMINTYRIVALALLRRQSFAAAAVSDIEWRERAAG